MIPNRVLNACTGSMIFGSGAPPGPNDSVVPEAVLSSPTPTAMLVTRVLAPKVSKAQMKVKRRQEEQRLKREQAKGGSAVAAPVEEREELAPLTDQDDDDDDEDFDQDEAEA